MAGSGWTCGRCGALNDAEAQACQACAGFGTAGRDRSRALLALLILMLVAGAAVGTTLLIAARQDKQDKAASPTGQFPLYTTPVLPPSTTATAPASTPPSSSTSATATTSTGRPCPPDAARYLPGGSGTALLVAQTAKVLVTICQSADGQIFYDGQARGKAASSATHIVLPGQRAGDGFVAVNGTYRYAVGGGRLMVSVGSQVLSNDALTPIG